MVKYKILSEGEYVSFVGLPGTDKEGVIESFRKGHVRNLIVGEHETAVLLADTDDNTAEYKYYEVQSPYETGPFQDVWSFRQYLMVVLNSETLDTEKYLGSWDALNNYPVLADNAMYDTNDDGVVDTKALNSKYFIVIHADDTAGNDCGNNTEIDGECHWKIGDMVVSTGTKWTRILRISEIAALHVAYSPDCNAVPPEDTIWCTIENVQAALDELYTRTSSFNGTLESLTDVDISDKQDGFALIYDFTQDLWVAKKIVGHVLYKVLYWIDGTTTFAPYNTPGNYIIINGNTGGWVPSYTNNEGDTVKADVNDIIAYDDTTGWSVVRDVSEEEPGSIEVLFIYDSGVYGIGGLVNIVNSNYVWTGDEWAAVDAYEPNPALDDNLLVANPNLGDISVPPYSAPSLTVATLRGRSISKILDDIMFTTIPHTYISPLLSISAAAGNYERGTALSGNVAGTYSIREGGDLDSTDPTWIGPSGADEIEGNFTMDGNLVHTADNSHAAGNRSISYSVASTRIPSKASTGVVGTWIVTARTADGPILYDNKGNETPRNSGYGGNTLAMTLTKSTSYYSRYPIWYGMTTEKFTVNGMSELTDITVGPNEGSNSSGTHLNDAWLQSTFVGSKHLFTGNISKNLTTHAGIVHLVIICPPGISLSRFQINVLGNWQDAVQDYEDITGILSLNGDEPRTYRCYYTRDTANGTFQGATEFRFTTTGTIQP